VETVDGDAGGVGYGTLGFREVRGDRHGKESDERRSKYALFSFDSDDGPSSSTSRETGE
jgi:hypothetical protein